jgi:AcrR family transcriptional regulator
MRGARNRNYIMDAIFELIQEGLVLPTAEQIADRAGVGTRTVFRHFDDMESLFVEMNSRLEREVRPVLEGPAIVGRSKNACASSSPGARGSSSASAPSAEPQTRSGFARPCSGSEAPSWTARCVPSFARCLGTS